MKIKINYSSVCLPLAFSRATFSFSKSPSVWILHVNQVSRAVFGCLGVSVLPCWNATSRRWCFLHILPLIVCVLTMWRSLVFTLNFQLFNTKVLSSIATSGLQRSYRKHLAKRLARLSVNIIYIRFPFSTFLSAIHC